MARTEPLKVTQSTIKKLFMPTLVIESHSQPNYSVSNFSNLHFGSRWTTSNGQKRKTKRNPILICDSFQLETIKREVRNLTNVAA